MTINAQIYGYIQGAYYTGKATSVQNGIIKGSIKPAVPPVEKSDKSKQTSYRH